MIALDGRIALSAGVASISVFETECISKKFNDSLVQLVWLPKEQCTNDWHPEMKGRFAIASFDDALPVAAGHFQDFQQKALPLVKGAEFGSMVLDGVLSTSVKGKNTRTCPRSIG